MNDTHFTITIVDDDFEYTGKSVEWDSDSSLEGERIKHEHLFEFKGITSCDTCSISSIDDTMLRVSTCSDSVCSSSVIVIDNTIVSLCQHQS